MRRMSVRLALVGLTLLLLSTSTTAHALDLWTPTLTARAPELVQCTLTNVSKVSRDVRIRLYSQFVVADTGVVSLGKGMALSAQRSDVVGPCRFTVSGSAANFRAAATVRGAAADGTSTVIVEAR